MSQNDSHRSTDRVLDILELVTSGKRNEYSLTEISNELQAPKSSLLPILHTLYHRSYLYYNNDTLCYSIGYKAYEVGCGYLRKGNFNDDISQTLQNIVKGCGETCHFAILNGGDVLYLFKEDSTESIRMFSSPGKRLPAYSTALGKALLSDKSIDQLRKIYPNGLYAVTDHTITDMQMLFNQLQEIRESGFAYETEESTRYIRCIAVPIHVNKEIRAALSVAVPLFRYTLEKIDMIKKLLIDAQNKLEKIFSQTPWPYN